MPVSLKFNTFQKKSISLPCRSHPTTVKVEEELTKIKTSSLTTTSADNICNCMRQIFELHRVTDNLLVSPRTRNLIASHRDAVWVGDIMDASTKLLDVCGDIRDAVLQMQEHVRDLECALRRRDRDRANCHTDYGTSIRKKMRKDLKEVIMGSKESVKLTGLVARWSGDQQDHLAAVVRVLMEVSEVTFGMFASVVIYVSGPGSKWNGWSKMRYKGIVSYKHVESYGGVMKEIESLEDSMVEMQESVKIVQIRLEGMQERLLRLESGLESVYRVLVKTRASLLNVMSM